jgi:hypothetical protein
MGIVTSFPASWRTDVVVLRDGGRRDARGNPLPATEIPLPDCMVGPRMSSDTAGRSDTSDSEAALYRDPDPGFRFLPTDRIRVPTGALMAGEWAVDGRPAEWSLGVEVRLRAP